MICIAESKRIVFANFMLHFKFQKCERHCSYERHCHIRYEVEEKIKEGDIEEVINTLKTTKDGKKAIEKAKQVNSAEIEKIDGENKCIIRTSAKFAFFVAETAILSHFPAIPEYFKNEIKIIESFLPTTQEQSTRDALVRKLNNLKVVY